MNEIIHPKCILDRFKELTELVEKYPKTIPIVEAAEFLGIDHDKLRQLVQSGNFCAGYGMKGSKLYNGYSRIDTFAFYNLCTNNAFFKQGNIEKDHTETGISIRSGINA